MERITEFKPIYGDTVGYKAPRLEQVPNNFGFDSVIPHDDCPLTISRWDKLTAFATKWYRKYEIVGETYADFALNLQLAYDAKADTIERQLEVYNDDIAKPILGRTEKHTYDITDDTDENTTSSINNTNDGTNEGSIIDVPIDNPADDTPSQRTKDTSKNIIDGNSTIEHSNTVKRTGTETTELSDLGVRPNYESLNGFLDNNRTDLEFFVTVFKDCFAINDFLKW